MSDDRERPKTQHIPWDNRPNGGNMELPESMRWIVNMAIRRAMKQ